MHALCTMHHALCTMHYALMQQASSHQCSMPRRTNAACLVASMQQASSHRYYALCTMHHALYTIPRRFNAAGLIVSMQHAPSHQCSMPRRFNAAGLVASILRTMHYALCTMDYIYTKAGIPSGAYQVLTRFEWLAAYLPHTRGP